MAHSSWGLADLSAQCASRFSRTCIHRVEGVLQHGDDVAVSDGLLLEGGHPTFLRRSREVDSVGYHRQHHLACTAEHPESGKDEADYLLQTSVGIETKPHYAVARVMNFQLLTDMGIMNG